MSRPDPKYPGSFWEHFAQWCRGNYDPSQGKLELRAPDEKAAKTAWLPQALNEDTRAGAPKADRHIP